MKHTDITHDFGVYKYTQDRLYDAKKLAEYDGLLGPGWKTRRIPRMERRPNDKYYLYFSTGGTVVFENDGSDNLINRNNQAESLELDALEATYRMRRFDGSVWVFDENSGSGAGLLKRIEIDEDHVIRFDYDTEARLTNIISFDNIRNEAISESLAFSYNSAGKLTAIALLLSDPNGTLQNFERIEYTYYGENDANGNPNDLKTVTHFVANGDSWSETDTVYYRYYTHVSCKAMKSYFAAKDFAHLEESLGDSLFTASDGTLLPYESRYFQYDANNEITLERSRHGTFEVYRSSEEYDKPSDQNAVWKKETLSFSDGKVVHHFSNKDEKVILHEEITGPQGSRVSSCEYVEYDQAGNIVKVCFPDAIYGYHIVESNGQRFVEMTLRPDNGKIVTYTMLTNSRKSKRTRNAVQKGANGTPVTVRGWEYLVHTENGKTEDRINKAFEYPDENENRSNVTMYDYELFPNSTKIKRRTTYLPTVSHAENGNYANDIEIEYYDMDGHVVWSKDTLGIISHQVYDVFRRLVKRIVDVDTNRSSDFGEPLPSGWTTLPSAGIHLVYEYEYDKRGRLTCTIGPENEGIGENGIAVRCRTVAWAIYDDLSHEQRNASGYRILNANGDAVSTVLNNPVTIAKQDAYGNVAEQIQAARQSTSGPLLASDTFTRSNYVAWTKHEYEFGRRTATRQYFDIPAAGDGQKDVHYNETRYGYDSEGRRNRTVSPIGTVTRTVFDEKGNAIQQWAGTNDIGATESNPKSNDPANDMILVSEAEYGSGGSCASCGSSTDNRLIAQIHHVDDETMRVTQYHYDWRGRRTRVVGEEDVEGRSIETVTSYDNLDRVVATEQFVHDGQTATLLARTEQYYDTRGRVWKSEQSVVDPENGGVRGKIGQYYWFDARDRTVKTRSTAENVQHTWEYDSLGRTAAQRSILGNVTLQATETKYDKLGNAILTSESEKRADADTMLRRYSGVWYDPMGRQLAAADYGYVEGGCEPIRSYVPESGETVLVSKTLYDPATGRAVGGVDPAGRESRIESDALGRIVRRVANVVENGSAADQNVTVETTYTPDGQMTTLTAVNSATGSQTTTYVYDGLGRLFREIYPDSENFVDDSVEFGYNRRNEVVSKRDQNGTAHVYQYDNLGRLISDRVTTLGNGVDGAVREIATAYTKSGNIASITSLDEHENVANQILYQYDRNDRLCREYTAHEGAVDVDSTPFIEHGYDTIANGLRGVSLTYPSGKEISYGYDFAGRVTTISDGILLRSGDIGGSGSGSGGPVLPPVNEEDVIVRYDYQGFGSIRKTEYVRPDLTLDYTTSGALDRFGRITDHTWKDDSGTDIVRIQHDYDLVGNRLNRRDMVNSAWSEAYAYDEMDQIASMQRTDHSESWQYDATGNWLSYTKNGTTENRIHNAVNEVLSICRHDANGNMTQMPKPNGDGVSNCVYDAWNRMVAVNENIRYRYDGRNFRIEKVVGSVSTKSFFNMGWQELESRTDDVPTTYVWGLRYIDDLIYRERNEERLYSLADPNWNAVATTDEIGIVQERFCYDAFGNIHGLNSDWNRTFTGQALDTETGLMLYRMRYYHVELGRFMTRDFIKYMPNNGLNLYLYVENTPISYYDPLGLFRNSQNNPKWEWIVWFIKKSGESPNSTFQRMLQEQRKKRTSAPKNEPSENSVEWRNANCINKDTYWVPNGGRSASGCIKCNKITPSPVLACGDCCGSSGPCNTACNNAYGNSKVTEAFEEVQDFADSVRELCP